MNLTPSQTDIAKDSHRFRVLNCGRRFGKTTLAIEEIKGKVLSAKEGSKVCYIAPTYQQARDIAWESIKKELKPIITKINESRLEIDVNNINGKKVTIILRGWESVETLRGQHFVFLVLDEVASMRNFWTGWNDVLSPTLIDKKGDCLFISTPKGFNHFYDLFNMQGKDKDYKSYHYTSYDNPHIPVEELEREKNSNPENSFAQEYLADFRKQEGLVYKEFSRDKHSFDDFTERKSIILKLQGIDWGYVHNGVYIDIEKTSDDHYWVVNEWSYSGKTDEALIESALLSKANKTYPDPENAQAIEKAKRAGLNVCEVVKGKGSIDSGVDTVRELFKQGRLHIHIKCIKLLASLEIWAYDDNGKYQEEGKDECDALRYPLMMEAHNVYIEDSGEDFSLYGVKFS